MKTTGGVGLVIFRSLNDPSKVQIYLNGYLVGGKKAIKGPVTTETWVLNTYDTQKAVDAEQFGMWQR